MKKFLLGLLVCVSLFGSDLDDEKMAIQNGDYIKGAEFYQKACDGGVSIGCFYLGTLYKIGKGVKQDNFKAVEFYQKACDGGVGDACSFLGLMYSSGKGIKQNSQKALELYGKACDMKSELGCEYYAKLKKELGQ